MSEKFTSTAQCIILNGVNGSDRRPKTAFFCILVNLKNGECYVNATRSIACFPRVYDCISFWLFVIEWLEVCCGAE